MNYQWDFGPHQWKAFARKVRNTAYTGVERLIRKGYISYTVIQHDRKRAKQGASQYDDFDSAMDAVRVIWDSGRDAHIYNAGGMMGNDWRVW